MALAEQFVLDAEQVLALDGEVAPAGQAHRVATGRPVERLGDRCAPVDHDRFTCLVGHGQAPDVEALERIRRLGVPVDATEHERRVPEIEVGQPLDQRLVERVALETGLERAAEIGLGHVAHTPGGFTTAVQTVVCVIDVRLLFGEIRVLLGHIRTRRCYR